jgi:acyl carrier protein
MIDAIKQLIVEKLDVNVDYDEFDQTTPLFEGGLAMDSIVFTEFIVLLEKTFKIEFDDDALAVENFFNIDKIAQTVAQHTR